MASLPTRSLQAPVLWWGSGGMTHHGLSPEMAAKHTRLLTTSGRCYLARWFPGARSGGPGTAVTRPGRGRDRAHSGGGGGVVNRTPGEQLWGSPSRGGAHRLPRGNTELGPQDRSARIHSHTRERRQQARLPTPRLSSGIFSGTVLGGFTGCVRQGRLWGQWGRGRPGVPSPPQAWPLPQGEGSAAWSLSVVGPAGAQVEKQTVGPVHPDLENRAL